MGYGRKITGGKYHKFRKKKKHALPGIERKVKLGDVKSKVLKLRGGNKKIVLLSADIANIFDPKTRKSKRQK